MTLEALKLVAMLCAMPTQPIIQTDCQVRLVKCVIEERTKAKPKYANDGMLLERCIVRAEK